jgi:iron(III) transport system substrate-binding protein
MKRHFKKIVTGLLLALALTSLAGCSTGSEKPAAEKPAEQTAPANQTPAVGTVNLYTDRHYDTDDVLYKKFTDQTGITVNVVKGKSDELIERLQREGADSQADLLITADAGKLHKAKIMSLLQPVTSSALESSIPAKLRDPENNWFGLTIRARVLVYAKDRVKPADLSTYENLTVPKWKGKILVRSSSNIYNQSLMASFIELYGKDYGKKWAKGVLANMARQPEGGDTDQITAVAAGQGDIAISNTYYLGRLLNSTNPEEKKIGESVGIFFPDQKEKGTHINVSGIGLTKAAKNTDNAVKFMEFLASKEAQKAFAENNFEYPANPKVEASALLKSWGEFKAQDISLSVLGEKNADAAKIFDEVGWK